MRNFLILIVALLVVGVSFTAESRDTLRVGVYHSPPFVLFGENQEIEGVSAWLWDQITADVDMPFVLSLIHI
jgi:hypothetical protein